MPEPLSRLTDELRPNRRWDWTRLIGGIAFALGMVVLARRKGGLTEPWSDWGQFTVIAVPCLALYLLALAGGAARRKAGDGEDARTGESVGAQVPWITVYATTAVLMLPLALEQLLDALGKPALGSGSTGWILVAAGLAAAAASARLDSAFLILPAILLGSVGGLYLIDWAADPQLETIRKLAFATGVGCAALALALAGSRPRHAAYSVDAAGILATTAAGAGALATTLNQLLPFPDTEPLGSGNGWETLLLLCSLALIAYTARTSFAGPAYIGAVGLAVFAFAVGDPTLAALTAFGERPGFAGWPALLTLGGLAAMLLSLGVWKLFYEPPGAQEAPAEPEPPASEGSAGDL